MTEFSSVAIWKVHCLWPPYGVLQMRLLEKSGLDGVRTQLKPIFHVSLCSVRLPEGLCLVRRFCPSLCWVKVLLVSGKRCHEIHDTQRRSYVAPLLGSSWPRAGVCKLWPMDQIMPASCYCTSEPRMGFTFSTIFNWLKKKKSKV